MSGASDLNVEMAAVGAELCVIDVGLTRDTPTGPGWLSRQAHNGSRHGEEISRAAIARAVETGIETARDFFAAGNICVVAGVCSSADRSAPDEFPVDSADDVLDMLHTAGAVDVAALTGCILGAAALRMPVVLSGPAAEAAIRLASRLATRAGDVCFPTDMAPLPEKFANVRLAVRAVGLIDGERSAASERADERLSLRVPC
jgi:nicotinate-nucleotide--dimethylbenzimidazole phosphoribosyltransferase